MNSSREDKCYEERIIPLIVGITFASILFVLTLRVLFLSLIDISLVINLLLLFLTLLLGSEIALMLANKRGLKELLFSYFSVFLIFNLTFTQWPYACRFNNLGQFFFVLSLLLFIKGQYAISVLVYVVSLLVEPQNFAFLGALFLYTVLEVVRTVRKGEKLHDSWKAAILYIFSVIVIYTFVSISLDYVIGGNYSKVLTLYGIQLYYELLRIYPLNHFVERLLGVDMSQIVFIGIALAILFYTWKRYERNWTAKVLIIYTILLLLLSGIIYLKLGTSKNYFAEFELWMSTLLTSILISSRESYIKRLGIVLVILVLVFNPLLHYSDALLNFGHDLDRIAMCQCLLSKSLNELPENVRIIADMVYPLAKSKSSIVSDCHKETFTLEIGSLKSLIYVLRKDGNILLKIVHYTCIALITSLILCKLILTQPKKLEKCY